MIKLLSICGSPTENSSTEQLLRAVAQAVADGVGTRRVRRSLVRLNELDFAPCQACGEAPSPKLCFIDDDLVAVHRKLAECDCLLFGSPIFFDSVSAQAKAFIDRCNCFRPPDFGNPLCDGAFIKLLTRKRPGAIVLVGGEQGWFEGARRCVAGFFKWVEVVNEGAIVFHSTDFGRSGEVGSHPKVLKDAERLGRYLARRLMRSYVQK